MRTRSSEASGGRTPPVSNPSTGGLRPPLACEIFDRRRFLARGSAALLGLAAVPRLGSAVDGPETPSTTARNLINEDAQRAIDQGLDYLARTKHDDGANGCFFGNGRYAGNVAVTSLAALALMAGGHQPGRGRYGKVVLEALQFVLSKEDAARPGFFINPAASPHGPMYGHGFTTLFLAEAHGMVHGRKLREELHDKLHRAVDLILASQNADGGWRYEPRPNDADLSVTVCQIMALRAARNAGYLVPRAKVDRCIEYVKACQDASGGFRYMKQGGRVGFALTAAGLAALNSAGIYKDDVIDRGLRYLKQYKPGQGFLGRRDVRDMHYFYGHYYAAQVMWTAGEKEWSDWFPAVRDELISQARSGNGGGSWVDPIDRHYATAMALLILQISNNYLSIFQK